VEVGHMASHNGKNEDIGLNLNNAVGAFVGANLFARTSSYVRMNSHLHQQRIAMNWQSIQIQLHLFG
jgi:hypothetical protein